MLQFYKDTTLGGEDGKRNRYCNYATALKPPALVDKVKKTLIKGLENYN